MSGKQERVDDNSLVGSETELRRMAERIAREMTVESPQTLAASSPDAIRWTLHELRVHQIELEMQNEELRRIQEELAASHARYFDLYDLAPVGYCTVSKKGLIEIANLTAAALLGEARCTLVNQPISRFIRQEDQDAYYLLRKGLLNTAEPQTCELRMVRHDGTQLWVQWAVSIGDEADDQTLLKVTLTDVTERKLLDIQKEHESNVLERLAGGSSLPDVLAYLVLGYETLLSGMRGSVLLVDATGRHLHHGAAPSLPPAYCRAIEGMEIGPSVCSCGTAAHTARVTVVEDIAHDPLWHDFKDLALVHGLQACWSVPILGVAGRVLSTFAFYFDAPRAARPAELAALNRGAYLASLAVQSHQAQTALRQARDELEQRVQQRTAELNDANERLQREQQSLEHLLQASDHERQLIAYDIHDGLAQDLAGALMFLETCRFQKDSQPERAEKFYETAVALVRQSHAVARRLISNVRPPVLDAYGVIQAIDHMVHDPAINQDVQIDFHNRVTFDRLPPIIENVIYRVVQEGLSNARRHSQSNKIRITCVQRGNRLRVRIRDWGVGFEPQKVTKNHFGVEGIHERARLLGGKCTIKSKAGAGTSVIVELPVDGYE